MAVSPADHRFPPLPGKFQDAIVLLARPHPVDFQSMNRPAVAGEQFRGGNYLCSRSPREQRMVKDDQTAAGREGFKQLVVASAARSRLNLCVRFLHSTLRQVTHSQVKQVTLEPERQLFADGNASIEIRTSAQQSEAAGKFAS